MNKILLHVAVNAATNEDKAVALSYIEQLDAIVAS